MQRSEATGTPHLCGRAKKQIRRRGFDTANQFARDIRQGAPLHDDYEGSKMMTIDAEQAVRSGRGMGNRVCISKPCSRAAQTGRSL